MAGVKSTRPPDLARVAAGLAVRLGMSVDAVERLQACPEHSLAVVMLRVAMSEAKAKGLISPQDENRILAEATVEDDHVRVMAPVDPNVKVTSGSGPESVVRGIDAALSSPKTRTRFPSWFIDDFWPGVLRRIASGQRMTDRELSIARMALVEATT